MDCATKAIKTHFLFDKVEWLNDLLTNAEWLEEGLTWSCQASGHTVNRELGWVAKLCFCFGCLSERAIERSSERSRERSSERSREQASERSSERLSEVCSVVGEWPRNRLFGSLVQHALRSASTVPISACDHERWITYASLRLENTLRANCTIAPVLRGLEWCTVQAVRWRQLIACGGTVFCFVCDPSAM